MLKFRCIVGSLLGLAMVCFTSCGHHHHHDNGPGHGSNHGPGPNYGPGHGPQMKKLPPGQVKKVTGSQSARPYAQANKYR